MELPSKIVVCWWQKQSKFKFLTPHGPDLFSAHQKSFNLATYKVHALEDYACTIHFFETTDLYTTQVVRQFW